MRCLLLTLVLLGCAADPAVVEVVIVPGAGVHHGRPSSVLVDRLECARALWLEDPSRRILVSGDHGRSAYDEVGPMQRYLVDRGVEERAVFMDHAGFRTLDTMERAARVFGVRRAIICTQALHGPRALLLAAQAGIDASLADADRRDYADPEGRAARDALAAGLAVIDTLVGTEPAVLGPPIPIDGDAHATRDRN